MLGTGKTLKVWRHSYFTLPIKQVAFDNQYMPTFHEVCLFIQFPRSFGLLIIF